MKRVLTGIVTAALVLSMGTMGASAACRAQEGCYSGRGWARRGAACQYVDTDGDGYCDACGSAHHRNGTGCVDADGNGVCDTCGSGQCGNGAGFVDADSDGVCDNYGSGNCGTGRRQGRGCHGGGRGRHR